MIYNPTTDNDSGYFKLDQTTPQTVINGYPNFSSGINLGDVNASPLPGVVYQLQINSNNQARAILSSTTYSDLMFYNPSITDGSWLWEFGQRYDTYFGPYGGDFCFLGDINTSGVHSGYRVPIIISKDNLILEGANNATNGSILVGTQTDTGIGKLQISGTIEAVDPGSIGIAARIGQVYSDAYPFSTNAYVVPNVGWFYMDNGPATILSSQNGDMEFIMMPTNYSGANTPMFPSVVNQKMTIGANGNVIIGTTANDSYGTLQVGKSTGGYIFQGYEAGATNQIFSVSDNALGVGATRGIIFGTFSDAYSQLGGYPALGNYLYAYGAPVIMASYGNLGIQFLSSSVSVPDLSIAPTTGNTILNSATDTGVGKLQVNGTIESTNAGAVGLSVRMHGYPNYDATAFATNAYVVPGVSWYYMDDGPATFIGTYQGDMEFVILPTNTGGANAPAYPSAPDLKMKIANNGNVLIGTATDQPMFGKVQVRGDVFVGSSADGYAGMRVGANANQGFLQFNGYYDTNTSQTRPIDASKAQWTMNMVDDSGSNNYFGVDYSAPYTDPSSAVTYFKVNGLTGNVLIGGITDNVADRLQVGGSAQIGNSSSSWTLDQVAFSVGDANTSNGYSLAYQPLGQTVGGTGGKMIIGWGLNPSVYEAAFDLGSYVSIGRNTSGGIYFTTYSGSGFAERLSITQGGNVLMGATDDGINKLQVNGSTKIIGGLTLNYVAKTNTYGIQTTDYMIDCTANTFTVTLPTAVGYAGQVYEIKNSGTGVITVNTTSSQTIDGSLTEVIANQYGILKVMSNGANWMIMQF